MTSAVMWILLDYEMSLEQKRPRRLCYTNTKLVWPAQMPRPRRDICPLPFAPRIQIQNKRQKIKIESDVADGESLRMRVHV